MKPQKTLTTTLLLTLATLTHAESQQKTFLTFDPQAKALLAQMTLDEKIGQMIQPDQGSLKDPGDIEKYFLGSLLSGGGSGPKNKANYTLAGWTDMVDSYQKHALNTRLAIPLLYGVDAVHGHNNIPNATLFPHNIGLGCTRDPALVEKVERITAEEVRATGINWVFAPCLTVPQDIRWGRTYEGFSEDPAIVQLLGPAAVKGFQGPALNSPTSVLACIKHFIADGGTAYGSAKARNTLLDQGDAQIDEPTLRKLHLPGYISSVDAGAATVMPSYSSWNGTKASASPFLLTTLLKKELGFEGFLISDYNAVDQISTNYKDAVATSINAGMDMVMMTDKYPQFFTTLHQLVDENKVPLARIDDAVTRILRVKLATGLLDKNRSPLADRSLHASFGSPDHRAVARQAVRQSLVLLKNTNNLLPFKKTAKILVAGRGADNLGMQCGGWTIDWQGKSNQPVPGATSILTAIKNAAADKATISYSLDASSPGTPDVALLVIGETPYAEGRGDSANPTLSPEDLATFNKLKQANIPTAVIILSGRPILLADLPEKADALIAAFLPGSEGDGVADILFGTAKPTGKLSFSWPRSLDALTQKVKTPANPPEPLYPLNHGLSYPTN